VSDESITLTITANMFRFHVQMRLMAARLHCLGMKIGIWLSEPPWDEITDARDTYYTARDALDGLETK